MEKKKIILCHGTLKWYFSVKHSLHILLDWLKCWALSIIFHFNEHLILLSFKFQMGLLSSVLLLDLAPGLDLCLKEDLQTANLAFQMVETRPM